MLHVSESDLFARALSGDWQARVKLYKGYVFGNTVVRQLGANYSNLDDFRQDVFTNFMRAGHVFRRGSRLSERVESVAAWTALERERMRDMNSSGTGGAVRLCAAIECDESGKRGRLPSYVPPRSGPEDSLHARLAAIVGEKQFELIRTAATESAGAEDEAPPASKTETAIGSVFVRAVDRLLRFFGAPPPLNPDMETVFHEVTAADAVVRRANPLKARGRLIPMQLDPAFYAVTPEMRKIGLTLPAEVRTITLWDAARSPAPPSGPLREHLAKCRYCADILRSLMLVQRALRCESGAEFLLCPGASTLLQDRDEDAEALERHLDECALCREERSNAYAGDEADPAPKARAAKSGGRQGKKKIIIWAGAAVIVLGAMVFAGVRYFTPGSHTDAVPADVVQDTPLYQFNDKYGDLPQPISVFDSRLLDSVIPKNLAIFTEALQHLRSGNRPLAKMMAERLANESNDPGARALFAECLFLDLDNQDGYREILKAEAIAPRNSYRCWITLQYALRAGDKAVSEREISHLLPDQEYSARASADLAKIQKRQ